MTKPEEAPPAKPTKREPANLQEPADFEDSRSAQQKRRSLALLEALKSRKLPADPQGKRFHEDQQKAIAARRAENARMESAFGQGEEDEHLSLLDILEAAPRALPERRSFLSRGVLGSAVLILTIAICVVLAVLAYLHG